METDKSSKSIKGRVIKTKYIFSENYNPKYANGAIGGVNPFGEIVINFYFERAPLPISQTMEHGVSAEPIKIAETPSDLKDSTVRVVENGVILNYDTAVVIKKWLETHIDTLKPLMEKRKQ